jgi:hypothetical protein
MSSTGDDTGPGARSPSPLTPAMIDVRDRDRNGGQSKDEHHETGGGQR